jgi:hypothetical protein
VILNWLPIIQAFQREIAMLPLVFVLSVTAVKDAWEDYRRARSDREINNRTWSLSPLFFFFFFFFCMRRVQDRLTLCAQLGAQRTRHVGTHRLEARARG